ncbi:MAG: LysR substrate-binding domain-containing protein [Actinoplanes sp.]
MAGEPLLWDADPSTQPTRRPHPNAGYLVRGVDETLEHVAAGRGISFLARSATVFYSHPEVSFVPVPDLAPDQVCLAVAASRTSPLVDDFLVAAQATTEITAECGNYEMWQLGAPPFPSTVEHSAQNQTVSRQLVQMPVIGRSSERPK